MVLIEEGKRLEKERSDFMPELPEVETVKETLKEKLVGRRIKKVQVLYDGIIAYPSKEDFVNGLTGLSFRDIKRRGKWLVFDMGEFNLLSHLRMEGKYFFKRKNDVILKHEHVIMELDNGEELRYMDTRKFGKMYLIEKDKICEIGPLKDLGLEPWDKKLDVSYLKEKYGKKKLPVKTVLLDQSVVVGIGNIYADEILFLSGINPLISACTLDDKELDRIIVNTRKVLEKAIKLGGTTIRSYTSVNGVHGRFQNELWVHGKDGEKCEKCGSGIIKIKVGGRGTYYCPNCQKEK